MGSPKKNTAYTFYVALTNSINGQFQVNPTIAVGDFKVSTSGGAFVNLATLPVVEPAGSISVKISLSQSEMNANKIMVQCIDVAGSEWAEEVFFIDADDVNIDEIVRSTTPANTLNVSAAGRAESNVKQLNDSSTALAKMAALYDGAVATGTVLTVVSTADFTLTGTGLSSLDNTYDDMWLVMLDGPNKFVPRLISTYTGSSKRVQFTGTGMTGGFPQTVSNGDSWMLIAGGA